MGLSIALSAGFLTYRKFFYHHDGIHYEIRPRDGIKAHDSITYKDNTFGATRWIWDFGDGEYSNEKSGRHPYMEPGRYIVKYKAYGPFGILKSTPIIINVYADVATTSNLATINGPSKIAVNEMGKWASPVKAAQYTWHIAGQASNVGHENGFYIIASFRNPGIQSLTLTTKEPDGMYSKDIEVTVAKEAAKPKREPFVRPKRQHSAQEQSEREWYDDDKGQKVK